MVKITKKSFIDYFKVARWEYIVIAAVLFLDLLTKHIVSANMSMGERIVVIPRFLNFLYTKNYAAAFGFNFFGLGSQAFFIVFVSITTALFVAVMVLGVKNHRLYRVSLALIIGGALGNLYCRIFHDGGVRDFIQIEFFGFAPFGMRTFNIFNLADSALVIGVILFMVYFIAFFNKDEKARVARKQAAKSQALADSTDLSGLEEADKEAAGQTEAMIYAETPPFKAGGTGEEKTDE